MNELRKAAEQALDALEKQHNWVVANGGGEMFAIPSKKAINALRQALEGKREPAGNEVQLNIIRYWPDDFAVRLEAVWKDLIGFIPNYKLYDLQKMLAEFGFTMVLYEGNRPQAHEWVGLTDGEIYDYADKFLYQHGSNYGIKSFGKAIEDTLKEKNT